MPSLIIDNKPTEFFYLDSGKPDKDFYTTIVIVHGHTFHSGIFQRILPLAPSRGIRLVCLNRRDYPGTTLYTPEELQVLSEGTEAQRADFLKARGIEIALFLNVLIDNLSLPPPTADGRDGGLALLGWSLGNTVTLAALVAGPTLEQAIGERLKTYLRKFILLEPPSIVFGLPDPWTPFVEENITPEQRGEAFTQWVSSYYIHGDLITRDVRNLNFRTADPSRKPSIANNELASVADFFPAERSEAFFIANLVPSFVSQTEIALLKESPVRAFWRHLDIWYIYGDSSPGNAIYAAWEIEKQVAKRAVNFHVLPDRNHFVMWDDPEFALERFVHCIDD